MSKDLIVKEISIKGFKRFDSLEKIEFSPKINTILGPDYIAGGEFIHALKWGLCDKGLEDTSKNMFFSGNETTEPQDKIEVAVLLASSDKNEIEIRRIAKKQSDGSIEDKVFVNGTSATKDNVHRILQEKSFLIIDRCNSVKALKKYTTRNEQQLIFKTWHKNVVIRTHRIIGIMLNDNTSEPDIIDIDNIRIAI